MKGYFILFRILRSSIFFINLRPGLQNSYKMKKIVKILLGILVVLVLGIAGLLSYVKFALPKVGNAPNLRIEITPERLERGEYLSLYALP